MLHNVLIFIRWGLFSAYVATEVWPPFRIISPEAKHGFSGIDIDILEKLEHHLDVTITVRHYPFARALQMIEEGSADIITGVAYTDDRAKFISYVPTSYFDVNPVFYTQKNRGILLMCIMTSTNLK